MGFLLLESGSPIELESGLGFIALDITPVPPITITTISPLPGASVGAAYSLTMAASGGTGVSRTWSITSGTLPSGLSFSSAGVFSGTPSAPITATLVIKVIDSGFNTVSGTFSLTVSGAALSISSTSPLPQGTVSSAYSFTFVAAGGSGVGRTWSITSGSLPAGLSLSSSGVISGTPTTPAASTNITVQVNDSLGAPASKVFNITINAASANLSIYSNGVWDTADFPTGAPYDLSFGVNQNPTFATNPKPGHTQSLQLAFQPTFGGAVQRASKWDLIPAVGKDLSAYTQLKMSILTSASNNLYAGDHYSRATGNDINTATSVTQGSSCWNGITLNAWSTVTIPFSSLGRLSSFNYYKGNQPGCSTALTLQVDDIIFVAGNTGWIYRSRTSGALESGWTDASTATPNYSFIPNPTLNANCYTINNAPDPAAQFTGSVTGGVLTISVLLSGTVRIGDTLFYDAGTKGTIASGSGLVWNITGSPGNRSSVNMASSTGPAIMPVVRMTPSATNQIWKATHAGFSIAPYSNFTFALIKPSGGTFTVQAYAPGGAAIGSALPMSSTYTLFDFGTSTANWTVYNVPWSALGAIGSSLGGLSVQSSVNALWYLCAIGVWS